MKNQTQLEAKWDDAKGRVKEAWGALTDDDVDRAEGQWDRLVATIREKTGETVDTIESKLNQVLDSLEEAGHTSSKS